jgi:tRNA(Ile)-lysidine synthase
MQYQRNLVRAKVIPVLKEINPNLLQSLILSSERVNAAEEILFDAVNRIRDKAVEVKGSDIRIKKAALLETAGGLVVLDKLLKPLGFSYHQTRQVYHQLKSVSGKIFESKTHTLNLDRDDIIISPSAIGEFSTGVIQSDDQSYTQDNLRLKIDIYDQKSFKIPSDPATASLDLDKLTFPLTVRPWQQGDRFKPLGMKGQKKLSDFMIDEKIPVNLKKRLCVLTSDQNIVWVIGWRIDDRYRVTNQTKKVFQVLYNTQ